MINDKGDTGGVWQLEKKNTKTKGLMASFVWPPP